MLLGDILDLQAGRNPDREALLYRESVTTYAGLRDRAFCLAQALLRLAQQGDRVAVLAENVPEYVDAYYGIPSAGMILTMLNYRLHPKEWAWILADAEATVVIVHPTYLDRLESVLDDCPSVRSVIVLGASDRHLSYDELLAAEAPVRPELRVHEEDTAWLVYTSGTTGRPKGAMITHRALVVNLLTALVDAELVRPARSLQSMPLCHIAGMSVLLWHLLGALVAIEDTWEAGRFLQLVQEHRITHTSLAATMWSVLLSRPDLDDYDLSSLTLVGYAGSAMPVELMEQLIGRYALGMTFGFGMTELTGNATIMPPSTFALAASGTHHLLASVGKPGPFVRCRIVDDADHDVAIGDVGELLVHSPAVMKGYWRRPDATAEVLCDGWLRTGDLARQDDEGFLYIVDRKKDMILTGGENVYSREVEESLCRLSAVKQVAVIGLPDERWGERVAAVVVLKDGATCSAAEVEAHVRSELAGYKVPRRVFFTDQLPTNTSGKVLKRELRDRYGRDL